MGLGGLALVHATIVLTFGVSLGIFFRCPATAPPWPRCAHALPCAVGCATGCPRFRMALLSRYTGAVFTAGKKQGRTGGALFPGVWFCAFLKPCTRRKISGRQPGHRIRGVRGVWPKNPKVEKKKPGHSREPRPGFPCAEIPSVLPRNYAPVFVFLVAVLFCTLDPRPELGQRGAHLFVGVQPFQSCAVPPEARCP